MAGADPTGSFVAAEFRTNIRAAMLMGMPEDQNLRPTFLFPRERTYTIDDKTGLPFDWTAAAATDTNNLPGNPRIIKCGTAAGEVLCAWEAAGGRGGTQSSETPFGDFDTERVVLTLFDEDFAVIDGFDSVLIDGNTYRYQFEEPVIGLFDVTVHQIVVAAVDES